MDTRVYNVGLVGYGSSAKVFHIPLIEVVPEFNLYAIVQRNPEPGNNAQKDHPSVRAYRSAEEMVTDREVDVVVVTTTPQTHYEFAKLALEHRKHGKAAPFRSRIQQE